METIVIASQYFTAAIILKCYKYNLEINEQDLEVELGFFSFSVNRIMLFKDKLLPYLDSVHRKTSSTFKQNKTE